MYDIEKTVPMLDDRTQALITSLINTRIEETIQAQVSTEHQEMPADDPDTVYLAVGAD